jgi:hypothetical protein
MNIFFGYEQSDKLAIDVYAFSWPQVAAFARARILYGEAITPDNNCPLCQRWLDDAECDESDTEAFEVYHCACGAVVKYVSSIDFNSAKSIVIDLGALRVEDL